MQTTEVVADGARLPVIDGTVRLPIGSRHVRLAWTKRRNTPELSYAHTVEQYKADYRHDYEQWQRTRLPSR
jgi:hypothetical protein